MGVVIVGSWKPRVSAEERIEHERSILRRIAELHRARVQEQPAPPLPQTNPREQRS